MKHYMTHNPKGSFYALDIYAESMPEARAKAREMFGYKRLPPRVAVWEKKNV